MSPIRTIAIALTGIFLIPLAYAHGDATWIMENPKYVMENGYTHCCGPEHCGRAEPGQFVETPEGVLEVKTKKLFRYRKSDGKVATGQYHSVDQDWWWCWRNSWTLGQREVSREAVCVFRPYAGF